MNATSSIELPARLDQLHAFMEFVISFASKHGFTGSTLQNIELCMEEALVNIFSYAYPDAPGSTKVECVFKNGEFMIKIRDRGVAFNPLTVQSADVQTNLATGRIGGYGIILIKRLTSDVRYERSHDENILTMVFAGKKNL